MAYSAAALSSAETAGFTNDKPLMASQSANVATSSSHWTFTGSGADTDKTLASAPAVRAHDDIGAFTTEPTNISQTITAATKTNPCVVTSNGHGLVNGDKVFITDVGGMTQLNNLEYEVTNKSTNTIDLLGINATSGYDTYTGGGKVTSVKFYNFFFTTGDEISFDTLCVLGHNLNSIGAVSVSLEIADNSAYSSNLKEIAQYTISGTTDNRILFTNLNSEGGSNTYSATGTAQRYSSVAYVRLKIVHAGATAPKVGEIFLGTRYQLSRNPNVPWNNKDEHSEISDFVSQNGIIQRYVFYRGQAVRSVEMSLGSSSNIAVVDDWYNAIHEGTRSFLWIDTPSSGAECRLMILDSADLVFPLAGPFERNLSFTMREQPPYLSRE